MFACIHIRTYILGCVGICMYSGMISVFWCVCALWPVCVSSGVGVGRDSWWGCLYVCLSECPLHVAGPGGGAGDPQRGPLRPNPPSS